MHILKTKERYIENEVLV